MISAEYISVMKEELIPEFKRAIGYLELDAR
jgi:hypothetical protein